MASGGYIKTAKGLINKSTLNIVNYFDIRNNIAIFVYK